MAEPPIDPIEALELHAEANRSKRPQHTGSIKRMGQDKWRVRVSAGFAGDGKRQQISKTVYGDRSDAERVATELQLQHGSNSPRAIKTHLSIRDVLVRWQAAHADVWTPGNVQTTSYICDEVLKQLHSRQVDHLTPPDIRKFYERLKRDGYKPASIKRYHSTLRSALTWAVSEGITATNPAAGLRRITGKPDRAPVPSIEGVKAMVDQADDWVGAFLSFALKTGARRGELAGLQWDDLESMGTYYRVHFVRRISGGQVVTGLKSSERKTVMVDAELVGQVRKVSRSKKWVFGTGDDPVRPDYLGKRYLIARDAVVKKHPEVADTTLHGLRHLCASVLIASGMDIVKVSEHLGHKSVTTTLTTYSHLLKKDDTTTADVMAGLL